MKLTILGCHSATPKIDAHTSSQLLDVNGNLFLIDLGDAKDRLGGSAYHQINNIIDDDVPRIDNLDNLVSFFKLIQELHRNNIIDAYHDKSDGGLFVTLSEMALAGNKSVVIDKSLERYYSDDLMKKFFFNEELGVVIQINKKNIFEINFLYTSHL